MLPVKSPHSELQPTINTIRFYEYRADYVMLVTKREHGPPHDFYLAVINIVYLTIAVLTARLRRFLYTRYWRCPSPDNLPAGQVIIALGCFCRLRV